MEDLYSKKIMVMDTEYDTSPKRLLSLAFIIYQFIDSTWKVIKSSVEYVKYSEDIFKVDENGEAFKYHKLENKYLQKNGIAVEEVISNFSDNLDDIDVLVGQNIMSADIQIVRKEGQGENMWNSIRDKLKTIQIYDTMMSFREKNIGEKSSLDSIYNFLFDEEMKDHHDAMSDCKNTFKVFEKMSQDDYNFGNQKLKFTEDVIEDLMNETKKCSICESKILNGKNSYQYINESNIFDLDEKVLSIIDNFLEKDNEICKKCLDNFEVKISKNDKMINIVKFKEYDSFIPNFFKIIGDEVVTIYLVSKFKDKDKIKKLGGKWDGTKRSWYFSCNSKNEEKMRNKFSDWIPNTES